MTQALSTNGVSAFQQRQTIWIQSFFSYNFNYFKSKGLSCTFSAYNMLMKSTTFWAAAG
jgi:hypothetical protein